MCVGVKKGANGGEVWANARLDGKGLCVDTHTNPVFARVSSEPARGLPLVCSVAHTHTHTHTMLHTTPAVRLRAPASARAPARRPARAPVSSRRPAATPGDGNEVSLWKLCVRVLIERVDGPNKRKNTEPSPHPPTPQTPPPTTPPKDEPIWVRREREAAAAKSGDAPASLPFGVWLIASSLVAIAAVGSAFELSAGRPAFGVVAPDSPLYLPLLGGFAATGLPTAGWLFFKAVTTANEEAARQDRADGYK